MNRKNFLLCFGVLIVLSLILLGCESPPTTRPIAASGSEDVTNKSTAVASSTAPDNTKYPDHAGDEIRQQTQKELLAVNQKLSARLDQLAAEELTEVIEHREKRWDITTSFNREIAELTASRDQSYAMVESDTNAVRKELEKNLLNANAISAQQLRAEAEARIRAIEHKAHTRATAADEEIATLSTRAQQRLEALDAAYREHIHKIARKRSEAELMAIDQRLDILERASDHFANAVSAAADHDTHDPFLVDRVRNVLDKHGEAASLVYVYVIDDLVILSGFVPDDATRNLFMREISNMPSIQRIEDRMHIAH